MMNAAFVFIKPHAVTEKTIPFVKEELTKHGINILAEGDLTSDVIDKKKLIDQHYYAIASKATILKPNQLNVPKDKFKEQFGLDWDDALNQGVVYNAMDACEKLGVDADKLSRAVGEVQKRRQARQVRWWILLRQGGDGGKGSNLRVQRLLHEHACCLHCPQSQDSLLQRGVR